MKRTEHISTHPSLAKNRLGLLVTALLLAFLLTACSGSDPAVIVPTDYLISTFDQGISYLTEEHPDVKQVTEIVTRFLEIDQTQDYLNPTYNELKDLVSQSFLEDRNKWDVKYLQEHAIRKQLLDSKVTGIIFTSNKHRATQAIATVNFRVVYTNATVAYAERNGIIIDEPLQQSASITLSFEDGRSSPNLTQINPSEWHVTHEQYYVLP